MIAWKAVMSCVLLVIVLGGIGAVVALVLRRRRSAVAEPVCGHCGYRVRGLPTFTCPECGSDLREVGIVTPSRHRSLGPLARVGLWTLVLPVPALVITGVLARTVWPSVFDCRETMTLGSPTSGAYTSIDAVATGRELIWPRQRSGWMPARFQRVSLVLNRSTGTSAPLEIDLKTMGYHSRQPSGALVEQSSGLDTSALLNWMADAGVDINDPQVRPEAEEILAFVQTMPNQQAGISFTSRLFQSTGRGGYSSSTSPAYAGALLAFWLVIWLIGVWLCVRRRKAQAGQPASAG